MEATSESAKFPQRPTTTFPYQIPMLHSTGKAEDWMQGAVACVSPELVHPFLVGILRAFFRSWGPTRRHPTTVSGVFIASSAMYPPGFGVGGS